jgi:hypothetical protein
MKKLFAKDSGYSTLSLDSVISIIKLFNKVREENDDFETAG